MFIKILRIFAIFNLCTLSCLVHRSRSESKNYCDSKFCNNTKQLILCKFQSQGPARQCKNYEQLLDTAIEKQNVLDRINSRRNKVASGEVRSLSPAENMLKLEWSEELEVLAQRWADQCGYNSSDIVEWCHNLENASVGQNVGTIYGDSPGLTIETLVDLWYMELLNMNASYLSQYIPSSKTGSQHYDYFTQLVWARSSRVGCGGVKYVETTMDINESRNRTVYKLICNFAPSGNSIGQAVYKNGIPCSRCPNAGQCDSEYQYLCSPFSYTTVSDHNDEFLSTKEYNQRFFNHSYLKNFTKVTNEAHKTELSARKLNEKVIIKATDVMSNDDDTSFDFLSYLFDITSQYTTNFKQTTLSCKDVLPVDEFIELLKNRLSNDQSLKDMLISISTSTTSTPDHSYTDRTVAAIVNQLYSKKETTTISKPTYEDTINSTLLADLVEAVIFRHSDRFSTTKDSRLHSQIDPNVIPIKIQAELGEIPSNTEFTGHYFFPEDEETTEPEFTENYDDLEKLHISEISLEIEDLKRNTGTQDFVEEILESDFMTENVKSDQLDLKENNVKNYSVCLENFDSKTYNDKINRIKRKLHHYANEVHNHGVFIKYKDLLKKLAADIRILKLNEKYHCSSKDMLNYSGKSFLNHLIIQSFFRFILF